MNSLLAYMGDLSGAAYAWLGHFRQSSCLEAGHNTSDAEQADEQYEIYNEGRLPNKVSDRPGGA